MSNWDVPATMEEIEAIDEVCDGYITIYPYPGEEDTEPQFEYTYDRLFEFSNKSIQKYNQDTGKRYEFVELVEALLHWSFKFDYIRAYFKACQPADGIIVTFVATTNCPSQTYPLLEVSRVYPWPDSDSDTSDPAYIYLPP